MFLVLMALRFTLRLVEIAVIGNVIATWLQWNRENPVVRALAAVAEPLLAAVRPLARRIPGPFDWSPMIVLVGLHLLRTLLLGG
jgi:YggT family protein